MVRWGLIFLLLASLALEKPKAMAGRLFGEEKYGNGGK
jgi:hypothetical protein